MNLAELQSLALQAQYPALKRASRWIDWTTAPAIATAEHPADLDAPASGHILVYRNGDTITADLFSADTLGETLALFPDRPEFVLHRAADCWTLYPIHSRA